MRFLWLLLLLFAGPVAYAQDTDLPEFDLLSMDQGLPVYVITGITQDSLGYLWVGTVAGLSRYDGYEFKTYRHQPGDTTSLAHDYVSSTNMAIDRQGYLWVGTRGGLSRLDPRTEVFQAMGPVKGPLLLSCYPEVERFGPAHRKGSCDLAWMGTLKRSITA